MLNNAIKWFYMNQQIILQETHMKNIFKKDNARNGSGCFGGRDSVVLLFSD